ncbi:MAG: DUF1573 domain-containing protein [Bacteroidia bacterium]|nr:DUF1573 domain-containing protein [Bacteroidia bacterium]
MKTVALSVLIILLLSTLGYDQTTNPTDGEKKADPNAPEITFTDLVHDFGKVKYAGDCAYEFEFKNNGVNDLVLTNVRPTCGCTIAQGWQEIGPVKKGKTAKVKISYDSKRVGTFTKTIAVTSNAKNDPISLTIKGEIQPQERQDTPSTNTNPEIKQ